MTGFHISDAYPPISLQATKATLVSTYRIRLQHLALARSQTLYRILVAILGTSAYLFLTACAFRIRRPLGIWDATSRVEKIFWGPLVEMRQRGDEENEESCREEGCVALVMATNVHDVARLSRFPKVWNWRRYSASGK